MSGTDQVTIELSDNDSPPEAFTGRTAFTVRPGKASGGRHVYLPPPGLREAVDIYVIYRCPIGFEFWSLIN